jgi:hypothetical protein
MNWMHWLLGFAVFYVVAFLAAWILARGSVKDCALYPFWVIFFLVMGALTCIPTFYVYVKEKLMEEIRGWK